VELKRKKEKKGSKGRLTMQTRAKKEYIHKNHTN
jgi:hypothetical protein